LIFSMAEIFCHMQPAPRTTNNGRSPFKRPEQHQEWRRLVVVECAESDGISPLERVLMMPDLKGNDNAAVEYGEMHERRILRARQLSAELREPSQQCASCGRHAPGSKLQTTRLNHKVCGSQCARKLYIGPRDRSERVALPPNDDDNKD
jgi:hypothetical protein